MTTINERKSEPVTIGAVTLYCEELSVKAAVTYREEPTVTGGSEITNHQRRRTKVTISGRCLGRGTTFILAMNGMLNASYSSGIDVGEIRFTGCHLQSFSAEDKGGEYISCTVTFLADAAAAKEV